MWIVNKKEFRYDPTNLDDNASEDAMENWRVKLTARRQIQADLKILRGIFQGESLSPLLFVIAIMLLNDVLKNARRATNLQIHLKRLINL